jgi:hypothetical protein
MSEDMKVRQIRRFFKASNMYMVLCEDCTDLKNMFSKMVQDGRDDARYLLTACERGAIGLDPQQFGK